MRQQLLSQFSTWEEWGNRIRKERLSDLIKAVHLVQQQNGHREVGPRDFLETTELSCLNSECSVVTPDPYQRLFGSEPFTGVTFHLALPSLLRHQVLDQGEGRVWLQLLEAPFRIWHSWHFFLLQAWGQVVNSGAPGKVPSNIQFCLLWGGDQCLKLNSKNWLSLFEIMETEDQVIFSGLSKFNTSFLSSETFRFSYLHLKFKLFLWLTLFSPWYTSCFCPERSCPPSPAAPLSHFISFSVPILRP